MPVAETARTAEELEAWAADLAEIMRNCANELEMSPVVELAPERPRWQCARCQCTRVAHDYSMAVPARGRRRAYEIHYGHCYECKPANAWKHEVKLIKLV